MTALKSSPLYKKASRLVAITLGCVVYAAGIALFLDPNSLAPGGATGISIMISHLTNIPTGTVVLCLNIPLLALGVWKFGREFLISTVYATGLSSVMINWFAPIGALTDNLLLAGIVGSVMMAIGMGIIFKSGGTTGGTDVLVKLLRLKYRHMKTGTVFAITDLIIVSASALVFKNIELALYAGIALVVCSIVLDLVLYGPDEAKLVFIVSDKADQVAARLLKELDAGVTFLSGRGAYSNTEKQVIMCAARKQLFPKIRSVVQEEDSYAFMIVSNATEIFGEGFKDHFGEEI